MTVAPAILFVRSSGLLVNEAVRLATRRGADLAVLDAGPACEQQSSGRRERVAARIAARVRTLDARLVVLDGGLSMHSVRRVRQELRS
jgi:hypothetical protein